MDRTKKEQRPQDSGARNASSARFREAKIMKAEKLQIKLDNLLQSREKKQAAFDKAKQELSALSKNIDGVKLKLFEILQSGSDDTAFSNWAKRKIGENGNAENAKSVKNENGHLAKSETPVTQNHQPHTRQNQNPQ